MDAHTKTCRICGKFADYDYSVKYGKRHYAHMTCWLRERSIADLAAYSSYQVGRLLSYLNDEAEYKLYALGDNAKGTYK